MALITPTKPKALSVDEAREAMCQCCACQDYEAEAMYCSKCLTAILEAVQAGGGAPPAVRIALTVLLNHVGPEWSNCAAAVRMWLMEESKP